MQGKIHPCSTKSEENRHNSVDTINVCQFIRIDFEAFYLRQGSFQDHSAFRRLAGFDLRDDIMI